MYSQPNYTVNESVSRIYVFIRDLESDMSVTSPHVEIYPVASYNNCNPGGPVGLPQGCKPIHWNPNTFLEKKVCWQIAQKLQKTSVANFTYLFWTLYFASRTKNKLKQLYFNGAVSMFFQQSLHLPKNKQPKWRLLWSHDPWDLISWFPLPSLGQSPMENPMLKG